MPSTCERRRSASWTLVLLRYIPKLATVGKCLKLLKKVKGSDVGQRLFYACFGFAPSSAIGPKRKQPWDNAVAERHEELGKRCARVIWNDAFVIQRDKIGVFTVWPAPEI